MNKKAELQISDTQVHVVGDLCFSTVLSIYQAGLSFIKITPAPVFDFSQVSKADSAGVALLLEWWRVATQLQKSIQFTHLPQDLTAMIKVGGLDEILH